MKRLLKSEAVREAAWAALLTFLVTLLLDGLFRAVLSGAAVFLVVYFISHVR